MSELDLDDQKLDLLFAGTGAGDISSDVSLDGISEVMAEYMLADVPDVAPPPGMKENVMAAVAAAAAETDGSSAEEAPALKALPDVSKPAGRKRFPVIPWASAAGFAVAAAISVKSMSDLKGSANELQAKLEAKEAETDRLARELAGGLSSRNASVTVLRNQVEGKGRAVAVWDGDSQSVTLRVFDLPRLDASISDYQLWIVDPQYEVPVDGGVFQVSKDGSVTHTFRAPLKVDTAAAFAVTKEIAGGVKVSKGPHLLLGAVKE